MLYSFELDTIGSEPGWTELVVSFEILCRMMGR